MDVKKLAKRMMATLVMSVLCMAAFAQNRLSGTVTDTAGEPVIGANVVVVGTTVGTNTGADGSFVLNNVAPDAQIQVSFLGYKPQTVPVNNRSQINIRLEEDNAVLDEVVVVGFGVQKKVNLTGSVSTVSAKEIASRPVNNVIDALQGMVPGMNVSTGSSGGALNSAKSFNIRGRGSIGSGSSVVPLVLIDGMEGDMNTLNPQDIETLSVLKDAAASSIYGSRAAGGVVLITTKKGKAGRTVVNYNNNFRFNSPLNMPEMADSYSWALYMNTASIYSNSGTWFSPDKLQQIKDARLDPSKPQMFANGKGQWEIWDDNTLLPVGNTDWLKEHFGSSFTHEHNLSVSGGSEAMQYYFSANYLDQEGALRYGDDNAQRYTINGRINAKVTKWFNMGYNVRFTRNDYTTPTVAYAPDGFPQFYHDASRYWPIIPVKDPNGYYVTESYIDELENGGKYKSQNDVLAQQLALQFTPVEGWLINAELNYRTETNYTHQDWLTTHGWDVNGDPFVFHNSTTSVYEYTMKDNYFNPNVFTEYSREINGHSFKVMAGFQAEILKRRAFQGQKDGIMSNLPTLNTTTSNPRTGGAYNSWSTAGFFGRVNYDYEGRYLFEANIRYDGSSRFIGDSRWGVFPSFSAGWNIAQERFMEPVNDKINMLKLRASWGELGNQNTDSWYPFYPTIGFTSQGGNWLIDDKSKPNISSQPALVSSLLTWEKTRTWEVGLDWALLNNRLSGTFGYFQRQTYDMVGPAPELPDVLGTSVPKVNNLDMTSKGWDMQISWRDQTKSGFRYGATFTRQLDAALQLRSEPRGRMEGLRPEGLLPGHAQARLLGRRRDVLGRRRSGQVAGRGLQGAHGLLPRRSERPDGPESRQLLSASELGRPQHLRPDGLPAERRLRASEEPHAGLHAPAAHHAQVRRGEPPCVRIAGEPLDDHQLHQDERPRADRRQQQLGLRQGLSALEDGSLRCQCNLLKTTDHEKIHQCSFSRSIAYRPHGM